MKIYTEKRIEELKKYWLGLLDLKGFHKNERNVVLAYEIIIQKRNVKSVLKQFDLIVTLSLPVVTRTMNKILKNIPQHELDKLANRIIVELSEEIKKLGDLFNNPYGISIPEQEVVAKYSNKLKSELENKYI